MSIVVGLEKMLDSITEAACDFEDNNVNRAWVSVQMSVTVREGDQLNYIFNGEKMEETND